MLYSKYQVKLQGQWCYKPLHEWGMPRMLDVRCMVPMPYVMRSRGWGGVESLKLLVPTRLSFDKFLDMIASLGFPMRARKRHFFLDDVKCQ